MRNLAIGILTFLLVSANLGAQPTQADAIKALEPWIAREVALKKIPMLSIAIVDDQQVVWSHTFAENDPQAHKLKPVYRVGSVSKPFTALLLMMLVELGLIDLDAPVQRYLPDFNPGTTSKTKITLRQMLSHRSGIVREGPVGSYFDDSQPTLAATVQSLNATLLVTEPGSTTAYSNMALAAAGYVVEKTQKQPFADVMRKKLLEPLGMNDSSFALTPELAKRLPKATMWTYHGREFPAPVWDLGTIPAGNLYSTVDDQAKFLKFLFAGGRNIIKRETLEKMWTIQYPKAGDKAGFGLGFFVSDLDGKRVIRHGGAVYGFATEFAALPDDKLGVIVCAGKDVSNAVTTRVAHAALRHMLAVKAKQPLPKLEHTEPLDAELARKLAGRYRAGDKSIDLYERDGRLWIEPHRLGMKVEVRKLGDSLITDDLHSQGLKIDRAGGKLVIGKDSYQPVAVTKPKPIAKELTGVIGEYGPDHSVLVIFEKDGILHAQIEWQFVYPLTGPEQLEPDLIRFQFPDYGLYPGDHVWFAMRNGKAELADASGVTFKPRRLPGVGETFKIESVRPVDELRKIALAAKPPVENNALLRKADLVDLTTLDKSIKLDIRYATDNNFLGTPFYTSARAFMQRPAAAALLKAHKELAADGYGLLIHDAYRPWHVTKMFRDATPSKFHHFVADPLQGSRHNRGCAVDLTLYDLKTGKAVEMPGGYDEFSDRSYPDYLGGTSLQRWHRDLLRRAMEKHGFKVYEAEWWHFDFHEWRHYPILNTRFEDLGK